VLDARDQRRRRKRAVAESIAARGFETQTARITHVPYKGGSPAEMDVIGGRVPLMIDPLFAAMEFVRTGKMKVIAVTSARRVPGFTQYPAIAETYPGFDVNAYVGFVVPSATPRAIVQKIQADSVRALNAPKARSRILELGNEVVGSTPDEFNAFIASDMKTWSKVIRDAGIPRE
jgi:tripartite-type tricarboxylate transporter receptor subunit TctC